MTFEEMPWTTGLFESRYSLSTGQWPTRPGEVVVIGGRQQLHVGDPVAVLGDANALEVVGTGNGVFSRETRILAAPGTWARLRVDEFGLSQLNGSILAFLRPGHSFTAATQRLAQHLSEGGAYGSAYGSAHGSSDEDAVRTHEQIMARWVDADRIADEADPRWTRASPLSFWVPSLTLLPLAFVIAFVAVSRRAGASLRSLVRSGVSRSTAVAGVTCAVMMWCVPAAVVGAALGTTSGYAASRWGARGFGNPAPEALYPTAATLCLAVGLALGAVGGFFVLLSASGGGQKQRPGQERGRRLVHADEVRRIAAVLTGTLLVLQWARLQTPNDLLWLTGLAVLMVALIVPDATRVLADHMPEARLISRLSARLLRGNLGRASAVTSVLAISLGVSCGFLTALFSAVESEREANANLAPRDQVVLDNDGASTLGVPEVVRLAAESVPALRDQTPVLLRTLGEPAEAPGGPPAHAVGVDTGQFIFNTLAFQSTGQVERAFSSELSGEEIRTLRDGGALIVDDRVSLQRGSVKLVDFDEPARTFSLSAMRSMLSNPPISEGVGAIVLNRAARELKVPLAGGALIYTETTARDAAKVRAALASAGIHPEQAWIYVEPDPVVPDLALIGSALALSVTMLLMTWASVRAQILAVRPWVSRLTQLGVRRSWGVRAVLWQYVALLGLGVLAGLASTLVPLLAARLRLPDLLIVVPWREIGTLVLGLSLAMLVAGLLALRTLTYDEAAEPQTVL